MAKNITFEEWEARQLEDPEFREAAARLEPGRQKDRLKIDAVVVGERHRKDLGDLQALAQSIAEIGLLHPIVVTPGNVLIAGQRRLEACRLLGWDAVPATVLDLDAVVRGEHDENALRKDFTPSEWVSIKRATQEAVRTPEGRPPARTSETFASFERGRTSDKVAEGLGISGRTLEKAEQVLEAAEAEPEKYADLPDRMDASGKVGGAYAELKRRRAFEARAEQARQEPLPATIYQSDAMSFLASLADESLSLLLTDPPYMTDVDDIATFAAEWLPLAMTKLAPTGRAYVFTGSYPEELHAYLSVLRGYSHTDVLAWGYNNTIGPAPAHDYKRNWQAVFYVRGPSAPRLNCPVMAEQFSLQVHNAPDGRLDGRLHAWQKPDALAEMLIRHSTSPGDTVADPFAGTGTFLLAASRLGRRAIGCDADPEMIALAVSRGCQRAL